MPLNIVCITGSILSGIGKGITSSSIGLLLKDQGINVTSIKIDGYINLTSDTMSPYEHGETFVTSDGNPCDLDLGNYERFMDLELTKENSITTGKVYQNVINKERNGDYLGKTVQIVPHITDEIKSRIDKIAKDVQVCILEVGGTIGDIENAPFIEAIRQMAFDTDNYRFCFLHVSMIIDNGEPKTKPTQHGVSLLRSQGINPDFLIMRTPVYLTDAIKSKLSTFCQVKKDRIISNVNVPNIYFVPKIFNEQGLTGKIAEILELKLDKKSDELSVGYQAILRHFTTKDLPEKVITIAGKYTGENAVDTYLSLIRAVEHASFKCGVHVKIQWLNTEEVEKDYKLLDRLKTTHAVILPGGFGVRGINGKILVAEYCRKNKIPMLGICYGMQIMIVELATSLGLECASTEWNEKTENPIIDMLPGQTNIKGGTMRLGNYEAVLISGTQTHKIYGEASTVVERHRHRYEFNNKYKGLLEDNGMIISGVSLISDLVEIVEMNQKHHPFYVGCQFHPEFKSKNNTPHPLFVGLLKACL